MTRPRPARPGPAEPGGAPRPALAFLERLAGVDDPDTRRAGRARRLDPEGWLKRRGGRAALREGLARLASGYLLREGGALAQPVFDAEGGFVAEQPLWNAAVAERIDWRLSAGSLRLIADLWQRAREPGEGPPARSSESVQPCTAMDVVLFHVVAEQLDAVASREERALAERAAALSPLTAALRFDRDGSVERRLAALGPWLGADALLPYQLDHVARRWLAIEQRRALLGREEQQALNLRAMAVFDRLWLAWEQAGRVEHLTLFARYYGRLLRGTPDGAPAGRVRGVLRALRAGSWEGWSMQQREAYEETVGRLFGAGLALIDLAAELRGLGWQRTAAAEHFLGVYGREFEPVAEVVRTLHRELCHVV